MVSKNKSNIFHGDLTALRPNVTRFVIAQGVMPIIVSPPPTITKNVMS